MSTARMVLLVRFDCETPNLDISEDKTKPNEVIVYESDKLGDCGHFIAHGRVSTVVVAVVLVVTAAVVGVGSTYPPQDGTTFGCPRLQQITKCSS